MSAPFETGCCATAARLSEKMKAPARHPPEMDRGKWILANAVLMSDLPQISNEPGCGFFATIAGQALREYFII
jgi:hypothetical protein